MNQITRNTDEQLNEKLYAQTCCICLEEQTEFDIEDGNSLIEYNHCGKYYVHNKCLNIWKSNECLICRKKLNYITDYNNNDNDNNDNDTESNEENNIINHDNNDVITIHINQNDRNLYIKQYLVNFCLISIGLYFLFRND